MSHHPRLDFYSGRLWLFPASIAYVRLQELARRSAGAEGPFTLAPIRSMHPRQAAAGYAIAVCAALGQFAVVAQSQRSRLFVGLLSYVASARSIDGLEGLLISGIEASHVDGVPDLARRGMEMWNRLANRPLYNRRAIRGIPVYLSASDRVGFIDVSKRPSRELPIFAPETGAAPVGARGSPSLVAPGMPGSAIGQSILNSLPTGVGQMDGAGACGAIFKYGGAYVGGYVGAVAGSLVGGFATGAATGGFGAPGGVVGGAMAGGLAGLSPGLNLGKEIGNDVCGGSSKQQPGVYFDPDTNTTYTVTADGTTVSGDASGPSTYAGEVDDPNFVSGGASSGESSGSGPGTDTGPYLGDVDDPNSVSSATSSSAGGSGSGSDSGPAPSDDGSGSGSSGGGGPGGGGSSGGSMDNPEADPATTGPSLGRGPATNQGGESGMDNPETGTGEGPSQSGGGFGRPLGQGGMENPETGVGEGPVRSGAYAGEENPETGTGEEPPLPKGFVRGGYGLISQSFIGGDALNGSVVSVRGSLFQLRSLPHLADSHVGVVISQPGLLAANTQAR